MTIALHPPPSGVDMLDWMTAPERKGASVLVALLLIGAGWDMWAARPAGRRGEGSAERDTVGSQAVVGPMAGGASPATQAAPSAHGGAALDLNRASQAELDALPGIGQVLATRILEHRRRVGPFRRVEDLLAVRGVGPRLFARLRPHLRVEAVDPGGGDGGPRGMHSAVPNRRGLADSTSVPPPIAR